MWCCVFTVFLSFSPFIYLFIYLYCHFTAFMGSSFYLLFLFAVKALCSVFKKYYINKVYYCYYLFRLELQSVRDQLFFSGFSSEVKPLSSQRTGSELQQPAGLRSEGAVWFSTESNLSTGDSEVSSLTFVDLISIKQHLYTIDLI